MIGNNIRLRRARRRVGQETVSGASPLNGIGKQAALIERASTKYLGLGGSLPITLGKERVPRFVDEIHVRWRPTPRKTARARSKSSLERSIPASGHSSKARS